MITVMYNQYGGIDWHDSCETSEQLEENGTFSIQNPDEVIAKHIYEMITGMECNEYKNDEIVESVRLEDIPTYEDILGFVTDGKEFHLTSPEEADCYGVAYELGFSYNPKDKSVSFYYGYGQGDYHGSYIVSEIPDDKVHYLVVENFLAPRKGVPSIQRMFHKPYETENAARKAAKKLKKHEGYNSQIEIIVSNKESDAENEWYNLNLEAINLMNKATDVPFCASVKKHIEELRNAC